jgi:prepilin-type N-terminal cleavage/methylation domain-containing protein
MWMAFAGRQWAFTLIEIILVIMVLGVLATISVPFMGDLFGPEGELKVEQELDKLIADLHTARAHALAQSSDEIGVQFTFTGCAGTACQGWRADSASGARTFVNYELDSLRAIVPEQGKEFTFGYPHGSLAIESPSHFEFSIQDRSVCLYTSTGLIRRGPCQ